jgi:hypothetical protein
MPTVRMASAWWLAVASGGLILWQSAFVLLYAGLGLGCALQFRDMHARELVPREMNRWSDLLGRCHGRQSAAGNLHRETSVK